MTSRSRRRSSWWLLGLIFAALPLPASAPSKGGGDDRFVVGALYSQTSTGARFVQGIKSAVQNHDWVERIEIKEFAYSNPKQGLSLLTDILEGRKVDVLFGPTESGIYVQALADRARLEQNKIPVISSMVTADVPHQESGWFFRTNVNVTRRAFAIYDFLNKYWIRSIAVLYADTEYGQQAEKAFQRQLKQHQKDSYQPLRYQSSPLDARDELTTILDVRPEAVGVFGEREDLRYVYENLEQMNPERNEYRPIFFTPIDARLAEGVEDVYFVTVTEADSKLDDVTALSFDTTTLFLNPLAAIPAGYSHERRRQRLRDLFEAAFRGGKRLDGTETGFVLASYENLTRPTVVRRQGEALETVPLGTVGLPDKLMTKFDVTRGRFGWMPLFNLVLVVSIVIIVTITDIKKWHSGPWIQLFHPRNYPFYLLLWINVLMVSGIYLAMAESGAIRYDSILAALAIAIAPLAAMRINLFETATGKEIGLGKLYDGFLQWVNDRLMLMEYHATNTMVNLVAYHNSVDGMKSYLRDIYRYNRSAAQRLRLETELESKVNSSMPYLLRRKVCARLLLRTTSVDNLQKDGMAPPGPLKDMKNPETVIREAARYCALRPDAAKKIGDEVNAQLGRIAQTDPDRRTDLEATLQQDLKGAIGTQGRLRREIAFLFVLRGFTEEYLQDLLQVDHGSAKGGSGEGSFEGKRSRESEGSPQEEESPRVARSATDEDRPAEIARLGIR